MSSAGAQRLAKARQELLERNSGAVRALLSEDGRELLSYLEEKFFNGDLLGDSAEETAFNLGAREVVVQLKLLRALALRKER